MIEKEQEEIIEKLFKISYDENPEEFDRLASKLISDYISSQPKERQQRLRGIQFTIESELSKYPTPLGRMMKMWDIIIDEVYVSDDGLVEVLKRSADQLRGGTVEQEKVQKAKVLPFKSTKKS